MNAERVVKRALFALTKGSTADFMATGYGELTMAGNSDLIFDAQRELRLLRAQLEAVDANCNCDRTICNGGIDCSGNA